MSITSPRAPIVGAVYTALIKDEKVFILQRSNTHYCEGYWNFPAGHIEKDERPTAAAIRETFEEAGVTVKGLKFKHIQHRIQYGEKTYADYLFFAETWEGDPFNAEPDKATAGQWVSIHNLPEKFVPSQKVLFINALEGKVFSEYVEEKE